MFFEPFPKVEYPINDEYVTLTNIVLANMLKRRNIDKRYSFRVYNNTTNKSLIEIAYELYGDSRYWWTILVANEILSPYDCVFTPTKVKDYCIEKYGENNVFKVHHYYNTRDNRLVDDLMTKRYRNGIDEIPHYVISISNYEYEVTNVGNQVIYYIQPTYINTFIEEYKNEIKGT